MCDLLCALWSSSCKPYLLKQAGISMKPTNLNPKRIALLHYYICSANDELARAC
ncbi:hypothetical protein Peur_041485 [Populus x canadensis]